MSEISDLVAIYGAIDQRLVERPDLRSDVATLIPYYRTDVRWYDDFLEWTEELRESGDEPALPDLETALKGLQQPTEDTRARTRAAARRLHAVTAMTRAFPETRGERADLGRMALNALEVVGAARIITEDTGLLEFLADPPIDDRFPPLAPRSPSEHWSAMIVVGESRGLAPLQVIGEIPCLGTLWEEQDGDFAAVIDASFTTDKLQFNDALGFLNPENWAGGNSAFWCSMVPQNVPLGPGKRRYDEVVSIDCPNRQNTWTVQATLDFTTTLGDDWGRATYELPANVPNPHVLTDQGFLQVATVDTGLFIRATKRVRFTRAFSGEAIALMVCALGYEDALKELVFDAAGGPLPPPGSRRLGTTSTETSTPKPAPAPAGDEGSLMDELYLRTANWAKASIDECATAASATADKISDGDYDMDALVQDVAGAGVRMVREGASFLNAWVEASSGTRRPRR